LPLPLKLTDKLTLKTNIMNTESVSKKSVGNVINTLLTTEPLQERQVALCWATRKRHIAVDGKVLCEPTHKTSGFSYKNGQYNSLSLTGIPKNRKIHDDQKYGHSDGIIDFCALDRQPIKIITSSICNKCLKKYEKLLAL
jgi:hypothetical protein